MRPYIQAECPNCNCEFPMDLVSDVIEEEQELRSKCPNCGVVVTVVLSLEFDMEDTDDKDYD